MDSSSGNFLETLLIAIFPLILKAADVATWVVIIGGIISSLWVLYQFVSRIISDIRKRKENKK